MQITKVLWYLCIAILLAKVDGKSLPELMEEILEKFSKLLKRDLPTKGTPFKQVKGPKSLNDKIAIIGAGPAGVHMAYLLMNAGFKNVHILEKTNRIGGKSYTVKHRGVSHEMGSFGLTPEYTIVKKLVSEFKSIKRMTLVAPAVVLEDACMNASIPMSAGIAKSIVDAGDAKNLQEGFGKMATAALKYTILHQSLFGKYPRELMPRPSAHVLNETRGTYLEFLKRHNLEILRHLFIQTHTVNGYGPVEEVPAIYGLLWGTPLLLEAYLNPTRFECLSTGFQPLWEKVVEKMQKKKLRIRFNQRIRRITRSRRHVNIYFHRRRQPERYDFLITTPSMTDMIRILDTTRLERSIFSGLNPNIYFMSSLYDITSGPRAISPHVAFFDKLFKKEEWGLVFDRNTYSVQKGYTGLPYQNGETPKEPMNGGIESHRGTQYGTSPLSNTGKEKVRAKLKNELVNKCQVKGFKIVKEAFWPYFTRFNNADITSGILWDVFDMQGRYNTWYIGSSVSFESLKSVTEYNTLLMDNYEIPKPRLPGYRKWWMRYRNNYHY